MAYSDSIPNLQIYFPDKTTPIVLGVSGGVDSIVLLHMFWSQKYSNIHIVTIDHGFRAQSDRDSVLVEKMGKKYGFETHSVKRDVQKIAEESGNSFEYTGRIVRYELFQNIAKEVGAQCICTAHHMDDSCESQLMHLIRGSGIQGLLPMKVKQTLETGVFLIRPLLSYSKMQLLQYARDHMLEWNEDETNTENTFFRNAVRNVILPSIRKYNPHFSEAIQQLGEQLEEIQHFLDQESEHMGLGPEWSFQKYSAMHPALQHHFLKKILVKMGVEEITAARIKALKHRIDTSISGNVLEISGTQQFVREFDSLHLCLLPSLNNNNNEREVELTNMSITQFEGTSYKMTYEEPKRNVPFVKIPESFLHAKLVLRYKRPGDFFEFYEKDQKHRKTLKKFLIEAKIPSMLRMQLPVIALKSSHQVLGILGEQTYSFCDTKGETLVYISACL